VNSHDTPTGSQLSMVDHALAYAAFGWPVFPVHGIEAGRCTCGKSDCKSPGKHPRTPNGFKNATTDPATIRQWWTKWANANIGVVTGRTSNLFVLDVDRKNGKDGETKLNALVAEHGPLPPTPCVKTGRGRQLYFALPPGGTAPSMEGDGLDVRCDGGYVVAPPSRHANGNLYQWIGEATAPAPAPDWLIKYARARHAPTKATRPSSSRPPIIARILIGT
jgi:putative DNA primase/helicase